MFHLFLIEAMEFRPRILVPKVGPKNQVFVERIYIFSSIVDSFSSTSFGILLFDWETNLVEN